MAKQYTRKQFQAQYPDDDACLLAVLQRRYGNTDVCPTCGVVGTLTRIAGRRAFACKEGHHIYPCAGTVFEHSSTPLTDWFYAAYLMTATRNGVSGKELERQLGVTYKCAWRIGHQLRLLMAARDKANNPGPLSGHVEIDETLVGGKIRRRRGIKSNKSTVLGMVERDGNIKAQVVSGNHVDEIMPAVLKEVAPGTVVSTDKWQGYKTLNERGYNHGTVNHYALQWKNGIHHTNTIEGFWAHLKCGILSTHVAVSKQHLQKYVGEFAFRYNNRHVPEEMFRRLLGQISKPTSSS
jgi:transposase